MDISTLLSVVHTILAAFDALNYSELKRMWSIGNDGKNLDELKAVAVTIKNMLLDADDKYIYDQLPRVIQQYIEELSFALYDADDLLDEFVTLAQQKRLLHQDEFNQKVLLFFSSNDPLSVARLMSKWVEKIETKLDLLHATPGKFGLKGFKRDETCSYPDAEIIGRDDDVEEIVDKLLHSDVSALTIVGMGGMGKTALVQLVFNHKKIKTEFSLRVWVCVSDHDRSNLNVKAILYQILESASGQKSNECSMEVVVNRVREVLLGKRFLIILDDLWTKSRNELQKLLGHLVGGNVGSQIVITTRSKVTANIIGESVKYELQGLSDVYSWDLFQLTAFDMKDHESPKGSYIDKLKIGKDIIKICVNVPLAIRVIGGLLYRQDISKWQQIQKFGLANLPEGEIGITPILKLSYHNLEPPLKSCFSYCFLYPKDFEIDKNKLISLWIAQGYVGPLGKCQTVEDVSEEYFSVLLRRCFFQNVQKNEFGEVESFKLHDLMHDVALEVSNKEICPTSPYTRDMDKVVRHVSLTDEQHANFGYINPHIRTYLHFKTLGKYDDLVLDPPTNYRRLRALHLSSLNIEILPTLIGELIHLRYLDLSGNYIEVLPDSVTKLYNLQTLDLTSCWRLKELPNNFSNLVNLRVLRLYGCNNLTLMPSGMSKLINLHDLSSFTVGATCSSLKQHAELEGLKTLKNLRGHIEIQIHLPSVDVLAIDHTITEGDYIRDKEHLYSINYIFKPEESNGGTADYEEELLEALQPHGNLKKLILCGYQGVRMPRWVIKDNLTSMLPNLVQFELFNCRELQCLPSSLGNLLSLKYLSLRDLPKLEFIETPLDIVSVHGEASSERLQFFPCLQKLTLIYLPKLKGWGRSGEIGGITDSHQSSLVFSQLSYLDINGCDNLTSLPECPNVEMLYLCDFNERLQITSNPTSCPKLKEVTIVSNHSMSWLDSSVPIESFQPLTKLKICGDEDIENLGDLGRVFQSCSSSLRELEIRNCCKLTRISGGLVYLTALKKLTLDDLPIVNLADEEIERDVECDDMPWGALCHTLQHLDIRYCYELQTLPKWMRTFTSLQLLDVDICSEELYERCQNPDGEDWPNIQHIPRIYVEIN